MRLDFTNFVYALSYALDAAEKEVTGATAGHGKRVGLLTAIMIRNCGLSDQELVDLVGCAVLHDNAISEYIREELEYQADPDGENRKDEYAGEHDEVGTLHAKLGERNIRKLPFRTNIENVILWHHENADGSGYYGKTEAETNLASQIIHLADVVDVYCDLEMIRREEFDQVCEFVRKYTGKIFSQKASELFFENVSWETIEQMQKIGPLNMLRECVPVVEVEYTEAELTRIAAFFAGIVDYKSSFTKDHSVGVGMKAEAMARYYGFDHEKVLRFAFAGALHDIGKMVVGNNILEKPDKLSNDEFSRMKNHASETIKILSTISDFEDITEWAGNHHEKLDGTEYPNRLSAEEQSFESRIMACLDIYQALTEKRPYKDGLSHRRSIAIMREMADEGKIDGVITNDLDIVFGKDQPEEVVEAENVKLTTKRWKCKVCGYVYEGDTPPASCPVCDSDMDEFVLVD